MRNRAFSLACTVAIFGAIFFIGFSLPPSQSAELDSIHIVSGHVRSVLLESNYSLWHFGNTFHFTNVVFEADSGTFLDLRFYGVQSRLLVGAHLKITYRKATPYSSYYELISIERLDR